MAEIVRRRRRPATSCASCRKRRIKCDRQKPCGHCLKSQTPQCIYDSDLPHPIQQGDAAALQSITVQSDHGPRLTHPETGTEQGTPLAGTGMTRTDAGPVEARVLYNSQAAPLPRPHPHPHPHPQQQQKKKKKQQDHPSTTLESYTSSIGGTWHVNTEYMPRLAVRGMTHKTRQLGQSHWMNIAGLFRDMFMDIEPLIREDTSPVIENLQKCKALGQTVKAQRRPTWPPAPSQLPSKALADDLVECYMRTMESVYRVVHIPSFQKDYGLLWRSDAKPDSAFVTLVKLVLAIGAAAYDDDFSLRKSAIHWVYEAHLWLADPCTKHRLNLLGLQIHVLTLMARGIVGVDGDTVYISAGDLLRRAVSMGLHVEPVHAPRNSIMVTEMRRRIWSTVLEICVQSSLASGGPPLLTLGDFDAEPPRNFDDDQLWAEDAVPKPTGELTHVSFSLALRKTFATRLAIVQVINGTDASCAYEDILRLDAELRSAYRTVSHEFQNHKSRRGVPGPSQFGLQLIDFLMQAYLSTLHMPFSNPSLNPSSTFAYSRRVVVETALKIWYILRPSANEVFGYSRDHVPTPSSSSSSAASCLSRFGTCGQGIFRVVGMQAALVVALELRTQIQEDERLESTPVRPDLLAVLRDAQKWSLDRINIGDANVKSYQMFSMIWAQISGLVQGLGKDGILQSVVKAAIDAEAVAIPILERMAEGQAGQPTDDVLASYPAPAEADWDISWRDDLFDVATMESTGWVFNDGGTQVSLW